MSSPQRISTRPLSHSSPHLSIYSPPHPPHVDSTHTKSYSMQTTQQKYYLTPSPQTSMQVLIPMQNMKISTVQKVERGTRRRKLHIFLSAILLVLTTISVIAIAFDIFRQTVTEKATDSDDTPSLFGADREKWTFKLTVNTFVVGGAYIAIIVLTCLLGVTRSVSVRQELADIPKVYVPINKSDLPLVPVFEFVQQKLNEVAEINLDPIPRSLPLLPFLKPLAQCEGVAIPKPDEVKPWIESLSASGKIPVVLADYFLHMWDKSVITQAEHRDVTKAVILMKRAIEQSKT